MSFALRILVLSAFCAVFAVGCGGGGAGTAISFVAKKPGTTDPTEASMTSEL